MAGPHGRPPRGMKPQVENPGKIFKRLMKYIFRTYKIQYIAVFILIFVSVIANVQGTMFMQTLIDDYIKPLLLSDTPNFAPLAKAIMRMGSIYLVGISATFIQTRLMV